MAQRQKRFRVSNPERVVYPATGFTKAQLVEFYLRVAPYMLPHLKDRPVTLKRYPDQTTGPFFYEKDAPAFTPVWIRRFPVWRRSGESQIRYIVIDDVRMVAWAANVNTIEFHPFLARVPNIEEPTHIIFDLDPGEGANILPCARAALLLRDLLLRLELRSFVKVSGSKGLQVYVPLNTPTTYAETQPFAKAIAQWLHQEHPELIVAEMERAQRKGKVFVDWSQNADYKSTIAVYSLRATRHREFVSLPVRWEELDDAIAARNSSLLYFLAPRALERLEKIGDLFAPVLTLKQRLPQAFLRAESAALVAAPTPHKQAGAPRESEQGGRRTFRVVTGSANAELQMHMEETIKVWRLEKSPGGSFPSRITLTRLPDRAAAARRDLARAPGAWDFGIVELIEGSEHSGQMLLYFSGKRLKGEYLLRRAADNSQEWLMRRSRGRP